MKILVTGATGFLGSHVCRELIRCGYRVTALRRSSSNPEILNGLNLEFRTGDLLDANSLVQAIKGNDAVVHAAADIRYSSENPDLQQRINVAGTRDLAAACRQAGLRRLVHVSSVAAIGIPPRGVIADENFPFNLEGSHLRYHISKKRAEERVIEEFARGLDVVIVNPSSVFGPHGAIFRGGDMVYKVRRHKVVPYFAGGICAVHVNDVATGIRLALERGAGGERYILGGENLTYQELARRSAAAFGLKRGFVPIWPAVTAAASVVIPSFSYARHFAGSRAQFYSSAKAEGVLGYKPRSFSEILDECLSFEELRQSTTTERSVSAMKTGRSAGIL